MKQILIILMTLIASIIIMGCESGSGGGGSITKSEDATEDTGGTSSEVPQAPTLLASPSIDSGKHVLSWSDISAAEYYEIYNNTVNAESSSATKVASPLASAGTSYQVTAIEGTPYNYWVKACNSFGCSSFSNIVSFETGLAAISVLNDTGITWGGNYSSGNNSTCTSNIDASQDCHQGRDATHNDDSDGHAGFSYTRLTANGSEYTGSGTYSSAPWACVRDNVTGLVWEVKTDDNGIHDKDNTYRWGGITAIGQGHANREGTYYDATYDSSNNTSYAWDPLVNGSNTANLCGYSDWRVPTRDELFSLAHMGRINPSIDTDYFPNTPSSRFWSSSPNADTSYYAWIVYFYDGDDIHDNRNKDGTVRLVRGSQ